MSIDPNKIIAVFADCRGTCKTPLGCTCGDTEKEEVIFEEEVVKEEIVVQKRIIAIARQPETANGSILQQQHGSNVRLCSCGHSETGYCGCRAKKGINGSVSCCSGTNKLEVHNWMQDMPDIMNDSKMVEVQFKNTRKEYFINSTDIELYKGDVIAVEASPGHDIGEVTLTGKLVELQIKKVNYRSEIRRVYRIAKQNDLEKYEQSKAKEHATMLRAREIAEELHLDMKISDVEFQGDGNKAVFYYIADGRVDFRQLIRHYASEFKVKIEMKQIGARQEAGRVGGIGPCGRELCCSSSMSNFVSVSTQAARLQDIPLNPQKLAGQCGKLKCCLNFEVDTYVEAQKKLPARDVVLETRDSAYFHFKTDILSGQMTYSTDKYFAANLVTLPRERVFDIIRQNRKGEKPLTLAEIDLSTPVEEKSHDVLEQESITRFDERSQRNQNRRNKKRGSRPDNQNKQEQSTSPNNRQERTSENRNRRRPERKNTLVKNTTEQVNTTAAGEQQEQQRSNRRRNNNNNRRNSNRPRPQNQNKDGQGGNNQNPQNKNPRNEKKDGNQSKE